MCGIAGIFGLEDKFLLKKMMDSLQHRGPDDEGFYIGENISIGHKRLSIIDLSEAGRNPIYNEDHSIFVVYNGEIYNFRVLKQDLKKKGHKFNSKTDSEVLVHAYEEWGIESVKKFNGMFAFALYDSNCKKLFLCRDQFGIKPLFFSNQNSILFFASELKPLLENEYITPEIDKLALYYGLSFACCPSPYTLYKGIRKLPPGHYLEINSKKELKLTKFYDLNEELNNFDLNFNRILKKNEFLLNQAIDRMRYSDVPQGVFLSGGLDSSSIVAILSEKEKEPIETFSIAIQGYREDFNELKWANIVHEVFETNHHEFLIYPNEIPKLLEEYINNQYAFIADPANIITYKLSNEAKRNNITVVHVGEGGDEIYCGYNEYFDLLKFFESRYYYNKFPKIVKNQFYNIIDQFYKIPKLNNVNNNILQKVLYFLERLKKEWIVDGRSIIGFSEIQKRNILINGLMPSSNSGLNVYDLIKKYNRNTSDFSIEDSYFQDMRYLEYKIRLPELILMRVDNATMLSSIEARVPFFDKNLVEYNMSLSPLKVHTRNSTSKYILKKLMKDRLPPEIISRKKVGLITPLNLDRHLNLNQIIEDNFSPNYMKKFFNSEFLEKCIKNKNYGKKIKQFNLWSILLFSYLYRKVILGERISF